MKTSHPESPKAAFTEKRQTCNSIRIKFLEKTSMPNPVKSLVNAKVLQTAQVGPDLLKALEMLSDTTIRRSAVDQKDLKPYWKSEKRPHFSS